ncbi:hypothetical protein [Neorhodopirellula lusitana]|uniref:hypothetical protein n=1 Tax=Neorhodopirellula lusitana TaxID=445327 RepID=UPI00384F60B1
MILSRVLLIVSSVVIAVPNVNAQTPAVPDGSASQISDWALAGIIWSDASLTKKLADSAAKETKSAEEASQYRQLSQKATEIIESMEEFGWKQVRRSAKVIDDRPNGNPSESENASALKRSETAGKRASSPSANSTGAVPDDQSNEDRISLNVNNYRVDDYVDETPSEARSRADAIEDGVEGAIAAASGRLGTGRGTAGRISVRESQTLSATLPYSRDSIYDADDYDPDVDFLVENPQGTRSANTKSVAVEGQKQAIERESGEDIVDNEDEMMAAMSREGSTGDTSAKRENSGASRLNLDDYTSERSKHAQDANWVQFHLSANQSTWSELTTRENLPMQLNGSLNKLKADMKAAMDATDNVGLQDLLRQF